MFRNYLLIALRNINRQKMYSALNIAGLAVGLAAFILTVSVLSLRAAAASPIKSLRYDQ